jgi:hypothetical protein
VQHNSLCPAADNTPSIQCSSDGRVCTLFGARIGIVTKLGQPLTLLGADSSALGWDELTNASVRDDGISAKPRNKDCNIPQQSNHRSFGILAQWLQESRALVDDSLPAIPNGCNDLTRDEIFWSTLVAGKDDKGAYCNSKFLEKVGLWESHLQDLPARQAQFTQTKDYKSSMENVTELLNFQSVFRALRNTGMIGRVAPFVSGRLAVINSRYLGLVPPRTRLGDVVCILPGAETPILLRQSDQKKIGKSTFELVGTCYVQAAMPGGLRPALDEIVEAFELH